MPPYTCIRHRTCLSCPFAPFLISISWLRVQIPAGREYRPRELASRISEKTSPRVSTVPTWALHVANNAAARVVHELHAHLSHTTTRACMLLNNCPTFHSTIFSSLHNIPVRPRTLVTFASLTGTLEAMIS